MTMLPVPDNAQHIGAREEQQDSFYFSDPGDTQFVTHAGILAAVADGMGGLTNGREASQLACQAMGRAYEAKAHEETIPDALWRSADNANAAVYEMASRAGLVDETGTTLVAAVVHGNHLHWIALGDSRLYHFRDDRLTQINQDHVYARHLAREVAAGALTREEAEEHPERNALTSYLGRPELGEVDRSVQPFLVQPGDRILLCSDGLYNVLSDEEMAHILAHAGVGEASEALVQAAIGKGHPHQDNVTVALLDYKPPQEAAASRPSAARAPSMAPAPALPPTRATPRVEPAQAAAPARRRPSSRRILMLGAVAFVLGVLAAYVIIKGPPSFLQNIGRQVAPVDTTGETNENETDPENEDREPATTPKWAGLGTLAHPGSVRQVAFSPDGKTLASVDGSKAVRLWSVGDSASFEMLPRDVGRVNAIAFSPDGQRLALGCENYEVRQWNFADRRRPLDMRGRQNGAVQTVAYAPDSVWMASGGDDDAVLLWSLEDWIRHDTLKGHQPPVQSVAYAPNRPDSLAPILVTGDAAGIVRRWTLADSVTFDTLGRHAQAVQSIAFSPDGGWVASGSADQTVLLWNLAGEAAPDTLRGHAGAVWSVAFSSDGAWVASGGADGTVRLWSVKTHTLTKTLEAHVGRVRSVAFSPAGRVLASAGEDNKVRLWSVPAGL